MPCFAVQPLSWKLTACRFLLQTVETNLQAAAKLLSQLHVVTQDESLQAALLDVTLMCIEDSLMGLSHSSPSQENRVEVQVALSLSVHLHVTSACHAKCFVSPRLPELHSKYMIVTTALSLSKLDSHTVRNSL